MKPALRFFRYMVTGLFLIHLFFIPVAVKADTDPPDLTIMEDLDFFPDSPMVGEYFDLKIKVQNLGGDAPPSTLRVEWCCGTITRELEALDTGEITVVVLEHQLMFKDSGYFEFTAELDPDELVIESEEANNSKTGTIQVQLKTSEIPAQIANWIDEKYQFQCADVDLMKIGRLGPPFAMQDSDGDSVPDRYTREPNPCEDTSAPEEISCQVYLKGQISRACGTTSLAYTLRYYGLDVWPDQVDDQLRSDIVDGWEGMFTDPIGIKEYAIQKGLNAEIYTNGTIEDIRSYVDRGIPVLLNISNTAGVTSIFKGHWVVVISFCEEETSVVGGVEQTIIGIYDPRGRQFGITPTKLLEYWDDLFFGDVYLWSRLYIPITDGNLPYSTSADDVIEQLALAQALAETTSGVQDIYDAIVNGETQKILEGTIELVGGFTTAIISAINTILGWGEEIPLVGGFIAATTEYVGDLTAIISDITQAAADLANIETWLDPEKLGEALWDLVKSVGDFIVSTLEYVYDLIVDGLGELFRDIGGWFEEIGCDWFDVGCKSTVVFFKHNSSSDACMESQVFLNKYARIQQLGYMFTERGIDSIPLYLYVDTIGTSDTLRFYYVCNRADWEEDNPGLVYQGLLGYSVASPSPPSDWIKVEDILNSNQMLIPGRHGSVSCDTSNNYGYIMPTPQVNTTMLYRMQALVEDPNLKIFTLSLDSCNGTETFVTPNAKGYTREMKLGNVLTSQVDGTTRLYRAFRDGVIDFQFYTDPNKVLPGFRTQGFVGYIFTEQVPGTVPLYQFYYKGRDDHLLTLDPAAEGLPGYKEQEILGYIYPVGTTNTCCQVPLWRFCKRLERQE